MQWEIIIGICVILGGIFIAGTALGTRKSFIQIIIGVAVIVFGGYIIMDGKAAFQAVINFINKLK